MDETLDPGYQKKSDEEIYNECAERLSFAYMTDDTCAICDCGCAKADLKFENLDTNFIKIFKHFLSACV